MDAHVLDTKFQFLYIIDTFASFIWTDRYREAGDFELKLPMESDTLSKFKGDYYLSIADSDRLMILDHFEIETDAENGSTFTVTGESLEAMLKRRILYEQYTLSGSLEDAIAT
jgi:hypothetical protein